MNKCKQVNIRQDVALVRKWNYTDEVECGLLVNALTGITLRSNVPGGGFTPRGYFLGDRPF